MKENTFGIPFKEVGKRLEILSKELNKHGMAILADSEATIEFGDKTREVATGLTLEVALFDKPVFQEKRKNGLLYMLFKKNKPSVFDKICKIANINDIGELSDGYHTFNSLYHQRAILFAAIVNQNKNKSWKSKKHEDGEFCFGGGWFIVGIDTPEGSYTYHYENKYWDLFHCQELENGKHWDGHTDKDVTRLLSLEKK